ncbi:hypothetical protein M0R89_15340 [Halorussus limi]|uniref:Uncharacterized protein n=2 Tax=Halorussus TaxID=1070314 RepID=A0A8U0IG06_9EURY|nr:MULTISPECIES: hypothetical protein [Halorussus]UPV73904.1 hypothetical protein M0R89_15340 [Halorussus limi]UPV99922.1 hypothetical protein M0R88_15560 [Halorussus gelatinilyticus]
MLADGLVVTFVFNWPEYMVLPDDSVVEVEMLESEHASSAVLTRDNTKEMYDLPSGNRFELDSPTTRLR